MEMEEDEEEGDKIVEKEGKKGEKEKEIKKIKLKMLCRGRKHTY